MHASWMPGAACRIVKLHHGETTTALDVVADFVREIEPLLPDDVRS